MTTARKISAVTKWSGSMHIIEDATDYNGSEIAPTCCTFLYKLWVFFTYFSVEGVTDYYEVISASGDFSGGYFNTDDWFVIRSKGTIPWEAKFYISNDLAGNIGVNWYPGDGSGGWNGSSFVGVNDTITRIIQTQEVGEHSGYGGGKYIFMCDTERNNIKILHKKDNDDYWYDFVYIGCIVPHYSSDIDPYPVVALSGIPERDKLNVNGCLQYIDGVIIDSVRFDLVPTNSFSYSDLGKEEYFGDYRNLLDIIIGSDAVDNYFSARGTLSGVHIGFGLCGSTLEVSSPQDAIIFVHSGIGGVDSAIALFWQIGLDVGVLQEEYIPPAPISGTNGFIQAYPFCEPSSVILIATDVDNVNFWNLGVQVHQHFVIDSGPLEGESFDILGVFPPEVFPEVMISSVLLFGSVQVAQMDFEWHIED